MSFATVSQVIDAFNQTGRNGCIELEFIKDWTNGDLLFIDKVTGLVRSEKKMTHVQVADYWSDIVFQSNDPDDYSAAHPFAQGRLLYVLLSIKEFLKTNNVTIASMCDFATGEGVFLEHALKHFDGINLKGTETSAQLAEGLRRKGFDVSNLTLGVKNLEENTPKLLTDFGVISWTLCNCLNVVDVLLDTREYIQDGGYLCVADSSRILVPFRKSLQDYLPKTHPLDFHPHFFSKQSISALLTAVGYEVIWVNRYFDSDILCLIAKKVALPSTDNLIAVDDSQLVESFMRKWHLESKYFETLRQSE
jgi:hypothetical protein